MKNKIFVKEQLINAENSRRIARAVKSVQGCRTYEHLQNVWKAYITPLIDADLTLYQRELVIELVESWYEAVSAIERRGRIMQGEKILTQITFKE